MAANTIVLRVFEFLNEFPPFNKLEKTELIGISENVVISYHKQGDFIFKQNDPPGSYFYINKSGSVELTRSEPSGESLVDICDEGDVFGVRSMLSGKPYILNARVKEDCLLYAIPISEFKPYLETNNKVAMYFAAGLASGQFVNDPLYQRDFSILNDRLTDHERNYNLTLSSTIDGREKKEFIHCLPETTIRDAAIIMTEKHVGSIIICTSDIKPLGIVTDTDLRTKVVTGNFSREDLVKDIMASPVVTIHKNASVIDILLIMLSKNVHHLCITEDGTTNSAATGIISQRDLTMMQGNSPLLLFREIKRAKTVKDLAEIRGRTEVMMEKYLKQELPVSFVSHLTSAINDAIIKKAILFAEEKLVNEGLLSPKLNYCWLSLGSEGREEQLLRTDLDNAIVYENPKKGDEEAASEYFLELGKNVTNTLVSCGFERCPSDMMASNPKWNVPLKKWKAYFEKWITTPEPKALMLSTIFFDYRPVAGDFSLAEKMDRFLSTKINTDKIFLNFFAQNATQNPAPLSFFRGFVLERNGEHKNDFDIKLRAMMPLVDAARVLSLEKNHLTETNTVKRYAKLADEEPQNASLFQEAAQAYEILMRFRALNGLANGNSGRYIDITKLSKLERQIFKKTFRPVEQLQKLLRTRFQLDYFN